MIRVNQIVQYIIQRIYHSDGMVDQFHIGSTNSMDLEWSISVRYAEILHIGGEKHLKIIFRGGGTHME